MPSNKFRMPNEPMVMPKVTPKYRMPNEPMVMPKVTPKYRMPDERKFMSDQVTAKTPITSQNKIREAMAQQEIEDAQPRSTGLAMPTRKMQEDARNQEAQQELENAQPRATGLAMPTRKMEADANVANMMQKPQTNSSSFGLGSPGMSTTPAMFKKGGNVQSKNQANSAYSGSTGSTFRRGDGIAQRGKTKGRMC